MLRLPSIHPCLPVLLLAALTACSKGDPPAPALDRAPTPSAAASATAPPNASSSGAASGATSVDSSPNPSHVSPLAPDAAQDTTLGPSLRLQTEDGWIPAADAKRILHVGDSMVPLVANYLRQIFLKDRRRYEIVSIPSSSTLSWARDHGLREAMYRYDPEVVLISLGSNELFDPNPERRAKAIRQIVSETRDRPCLWIGPPAWKKDKGFLRVLQQNVGRCQYFDSAVLKLDRMADGRHPSWTGSYDWAVAVWKVLGGTQRIPAGNVAPKSR